MLFQFYFLLFIVTSPTSNIVCCIFLHRQQTNLVFYYWKCSSFVPIHLSIACYLACVVTVKQFGEWEEVPYQIFIYQFSFVFIDKRFIT